MRMNFWNFGSAGRFLEVSLIGYPLKPAHEHLYLETSLLFVMNMPCKRKIDLIDFVESHHSLMELKRAF